MNVRTRLIDAAARVYAEHGYRGATTRLISREAGVNEVTLFRRFGTKDVLLKEAIRALSAAGSGAGLPDRPAAPRRELRAWAGGLMRQLTERRGLIRTCMGEMGDHPEVVLAVRERTEGAVRDLRRYVRRLQAAGLARRDVPPGAAAGLLVGAIFSESTGRDLMPSLYPRRSETSVTGYVDLFLRALGAGAASGRGGRRGKARGR